MGIYIRDVAFNLCRIRTSYKSKKKKRHAFREGISVLVWENSNAFG